jgi:hypothetical protein
MIHFHPDDRETRISREYSREQLTGLLLPPAF